MDEEWFLASLGAKGESTKGSNHAVTSAYSKIPNSRVTWEKHLKRKREQQERTNDH